MLSNFKNKLQTNEVKNWQKLRTASLSSKFIGSYEKQCNYTVVWGMNYYEQCKNISVTLGQNSLLVLFQLKSTIKPLKF